VVAQGTLLWQPVNLGDVRKRCKEGPLFFASAFDNGLADRKSAFKMFDGNYQATSYPNLVNFGPITIGVYAVKVRNFCRDLRAI